MLGKLNESLMVLSGARLASFALEKMGYEIKRIKNNVPVDITNDAGDVLSLRSCIEQKEFIINAEMQAGIGLFRYSLSASGPHPFVKAVLASIDVSRDGGDEKSAIRQSLASFYGSFAPVSAADFLGMRPEDIGYREWVDQPPWAFVKPWESTSPSERLKQMAISERRDNLQASHGALTIKDGCNFCGPVSDAKLSAEAGRLHAIKCSITKHGFLRDDSSDGDIRADLMVKEREGWRWSVRSGQHRVAVLSALGFGKVPIRVSRIVVRGEVDYWPGVVSGLFSRRHALALFDEVYNGKGKVLP